MVSSYTGRHYIPFLYKTRSWVFEHLQEGLCGVGRCVQLIPVSIVHSSFRLRRILLVSAFYAFNFSLARLFMDIKTGTMLLSLQTKTENLPFHVKHRDLVSSKIKKEESVFYIDSMLITTLLLQRTQSPAVISVYPKNHPFAYHLNIWIG